MKVKWLRSDNGEYLTVFTELEDSTMTSLQNRRNIYACFRRTEAKARGARVARERRRFFSAPSLALASLSPLFA